MLMVALMLFAGPLVWMLSTMLKTKAETYKVPPTILPDTFSLEAFERLFAVQPMMWQWIQNSFIISFLLQREQWCPARLSLTVFPVLQTGTEIFCSRLCLLP